MIDPSVIAAAAAAKLNVAEADVLPSATAAIAYIAKDISGTLDDLDPADALVLEGATLLCQRIYLDVPTRSGELDPFGSVTMTGVMIPADKGTGLRDYWTHAQHRWGIG